LTLQGLNSNQTAIGQNVNGILAAGASAGFTAVTNALLAATDLGGALDQLSPEVYNQAKLGTFYGARSFASNMLSCRTNGDEGASFISEGQCVWVRAQARSLDLSHTANNIGAQERTGSFSAGAQLALAPAWRAGFAVGYDTSTITTGSGAKSEGDRINIGGIVKYNPGPLLLAAGVTAGWGSFDTTRDLAFGGFAAQARGKSDVDYVSGQLHGAYLMQSDGWYMKPIVGAAVTQVSLGRVVETGGGGAGLTVAASDDTVFSVSPAVEFGTQVAFDDISVWRPFVRVGVTWQDESRFALTASFTDAGAGATPFTIGSKLDRTLFDVSAGVDVINTSGAVMRLQYDGHFGDETRENSVSVKGSVKF
jgi:uncharacterized protein with beta-barrel porin domain